VARIALNFLPIFLLIFTQRALPAEQWLRINSTNFELFTTAGEKKGREAILYFEQVRAVFEKFAKSKSISTTPVRIVAFQSDKEFKPYRINEFATAYYLGSRDRDYIVMKSIASEHYPTAIHEYTHLIMKHSGLPVPVWLNEGLAEVFSTLRPAGKQVLIGNLIPGRVQELQTGKWLPLETLIAVDHRSPLYNEKARAGMFYAESWALTYMLYLSNEYLPKFGELLRLLKADDSQAAVFQQVYGKSLPQIKSELEGFMRGSRFNAAVVDVKLEKSAESPDVRPATALESGLTLADLLAVTRKRDEARAAYENLAKEYPKETEIPLAQARLAWMNRDRDEMKRYFARAIELGSKNAKVHFDYAMMLRESDAAADEIVGLLNTAALLQPDMTEANYMLGFYAMNASRFGEAVSHFNKVKKVDKAQAFPLFRALAYASYRLGSREEAAKHAESALKYAVEPEDVRVAKELLAYVTQDPSARTPVLRADGQPRLTRPEPDSAEPESKVSVFAERTYPIEGTLEQVDCLDKVARLRILVGAKHVSLLIEDPSKIVIKSAVAGQHEFTCGPQKPVKVAVEYILKPEDTYKTEGAIRSIEFRSTGALRVRD